MPNTIIQRRLIRRSLLDPVVRNYRDVVLPALGLSLPSTIVKPLDVFVKGCRKAGIWSKMLEVNMYPVSGSVAIVGTPLQLGPTGPDSGLYQWSNRGGNFVDGDVTINGVAGNASTKAFVTGIRPSGTFSSANSAGLTVYVSTIDTVGYDAGGYGTSGVNPLLGIAANASSNFRADCWDNNGVSSLASAAPNLAGFYSASRISATDFRSYFANSTNAFAQKSINTNASAQTWFGGAGNNNLCVCGVEFSGTLVAATARRQSFFCAHEGLTAVETQALFNLVQAFLIAKGGGFV